MRGASKTTDELRNFWNERSVIEEEYAAKLAKLAKAPIGGDEIGELRNSLDTLRIETEEQAQSHSKLAQSIRTGLEAPTAELHAKQVNHRRNVQAPLERKFKEKQLHESYVKKSREKYESDCVRLRSYTQQATYMHGTDLVKVQQKLQRTQQTMQGNERDFTKFTKELLEMLPAWEKEWKEFCDSCQDLEEDRLDFTKDILWTYANHISMICVSDDQSCERIRTALDQMEPERDIVNFVNEYGTGNSVAQPTDFVATTLQGDPQMPSSPTVRTANYQRITRRDPQPAYHNESDIMDNHTAHDPTGDTASQVTSQAHSNHPNHINGDGLSYQGTTHSSPQADTISIAYSTSRTQASPPQTNPPSHPPPPVPEPQQTLAAPIPAVSQSTAGSSRSVSPANPNGTSRTATNPNRVSVPLPVTPQGGGRGPGRAQTPPPPLPQPTSRILFYVKALYDYQATIQEEFDFQAGDVIAVTATPDDGWWSGELLDEARREEGRNVFPSNFVCLF